MTTPSRVFCEHIQVLTFSQHSLDWPCTHYVVQAGLELTAMLQPHPYSPTFSALIRSVGHQNWLTRVLWGMAKSVLSEGIKRAGYSRGRETTVTKLRVRQRQRTKYSLRKAAVRRSSHQRRNVWKNASAHQANSAPVQPSELCLCHLQRRGS